MPLDGLDLRPRVGLSLCSGAGGLDLGLQLAEPGFETACFVEWEDYPQRALHAAQRAGYFAPAPIWDDVTTFDGRPWRGIIDTITAGYPCQPFSSAGKRKGADDDRHLWPDVARIIREVGPRWVFLENVAGHISLGLETVLRELREMGFDVAAQPFSAAEIGASHERLRIFIVAYSKDNCRRLYEGSGPEGARAPDTARRGKSMGAGQTLAYSQSRGCGELRDALQPRGRGHADSGHTPMEDTRHPVGRAHDAGRDHTDRNDAGRQESDRGAGKPSQDVGNAVGESGELRRKPGDLRSEGQGSQSAGVSGSGPQSWAAGPEVANTQGVDRRGEFQEGGEGGRRPGPARVGGRVDDAAGPRQQGRLTGSSGAIRDETRGAESSRRRDYVADASPAGLQGREQPGSLGQRHRAETHGPVAERRGPRIFPPGPNEGSAWADVICTAPDLAPALSRGGVVQASALYLAPLLAAGSRPPEQSGAGGVEGQGQLSAMGDEAPQALEWTEIERCVYRMVDGLAARTRALKLLGNGVLPLAAANAWRNLARDLGLAPLDMGAANENA